MEAQLSGHAVQWGKHSPSTSSPPRDQRRGRRWDGTWASRRNIHIAAEALAGLIVLLVAQTAIAQTAIAQTDAGFHRGEWNGRRRHARRQPSGRRR
jgi:hypothetical protein